MRPQVVRNLAPRPEPPSIRELEVLTALVRLRKTTSAAVSLGISQPAVSRVLAQLEARLGCALFLRESGRLSPTPEALALDEQARPILAALDRLATWPAGAPSSGLLRICASPTLAHHLLPPVVARFREIAPEVTVQVEIGNGPTVLAAVADRVADLGLMDTPPAHPAVMAEPFRLGQAHCVMPDGHPLSVLSSIGVEDLAGHPIVALARRFASRASVDAAFGQAGLQPRIVAEASTSAFAVGLVLQGAGVALLNPFPVCQAGMAGLVARPFRPSIPYRTSLLFPSAGGAATIARRFADLLKEMQPEDGLTTPLR